MNLEDLITKTCVAFNARDIDAVLAVLHPGVDWAFSWHEAGSVKVVLPRPTPSGLTPAVETVEKVPFQKLISGKWDRNIEKRLVFCVPNNILAIFEPVVGDFCEIFLSKRFFDSLVRWLLGYSRSLLKKSELQV